MSPAIRIPTTGSPQRQKADICQRVLAQIILKLAMALTLALGLTGTALAIDQPPETTPQQQAWLLSHLVTDMQSVGSFTSNDIAQMVTLVNALTDDQVSLLARFYYLTREKTEQDAQLYAVEQTDTGEALTQAKAEVADLLTRLHNQIEQTYSDLATINPGCQTMCQIAYASVPGWCAYNQYAIPDWYYSGGCYVGPVFSAGYSGTYAVPVYTTFYNRASRYNYWNSRAYLRNNITRIAHRHRGTSRIRGNHHGFGTAANQNALPVPKHKTTSPVTNYTPTAIARQNTPKLHNRVSPAKNHTDAPAVSHAQQARPASHSKPQAVAHNQPKPAAQPKARAQAHAAPHPQQHHPAQASHPQHVAQAQPKSGHGRHK